MRQPGRESKRRRGYEKTLSANEPRWFEPANLRLEKEKGGGTSQVLSKRIEKKPQSEQTNTGTQPAATPKRYEANEMETPQKDVNNPTASQGGQTVDIELTQE